MVKSTDWVKKKKKRKEKKKGPFKKQMVKTSVAYFRILWFSYRVVVETSGRTSVPNSNLSTPPPRVINTSLQPLSSIYGLTSPYCCRSCHAPPPFSFQVKHQRIVSTSTTAVCGQKRRSKPRIRSPSIYFCRSVLHDLILFCGFWLS